MEEDKDSDDRLLEDVRSTESPNPSWYDMCKEEEIEVEGQKKRGADQDQDQAKKKACREKRILVVGDSMVKDIEKESGKFVGKEVNVKVVSSSGAKIWHLDKHLRKFKTVFGEEEIDDIVIHGGTNHVERGTSRIHAGIVRGAVEDLLMGTAERIGMEKCALSGILPRGDMLSTELMAGNQRIKAINDAIACNWVVRKGGGTFISNWVITFMREGTAQTSLEMGYTVPKSGRMALVKGIRRGIDAMLHESAKSQGN